MQIEYDGGGGGEEQEKEQDECFPAFYSSYMGNGGVKKALKQFFKLKLKKLEGYPEAPPRKLKFFPWKYENIVDLTITCPVSPKIVHFSLKFGLCPPMPRSPSTNQVKKKPLRHEPKEWR